MDAAPIRELFVGNLTERTTLNDLKYCFSKYGDVESCILCNSLKHFQKDSYFEKVYYGYYALVTFGTAEDVLRAMKDGDRNQISLHNKNLKVMPAGSWYQFDYIGQYKYLEEIEIHDKKNTDDQHTQGYLQNDSKKVSIHTLNNDCLRQIFEFLPIFDRIRAERVCKRWKAVSLESWHTMRVLDFYSRHKWGSVDVRKINVPFRDTKILRKLLLRCGRFLTQLDLSICPCRKLSKDILITIGQLCPNITDVNLRGINSNVSIINALTKNFKNITRFYHGYSDYLDKELDNKLNDLFSICENLEYFKIIENKVLNKCLASLSAEKLHTLILHHTKIICNDFYDGHLPMALKRLRSLEKLVIYSNINVEILESISCYCVNLKVLHLDGWKNRRVINSLKFSNLVKLENIKIAHNKGVSDNYVTNMVLNCQELVDVNIKGCCEVTDAGLMSIATLPKLERLNINKIEGITDQGLRHIRDLKVLECRKCMCTEEGLSMVLRSSPQLRLLDIFICHSVKRPFLEIAKEICNRRTSNILLKVNVTEWLFRSIFPNMNEWHTAEILVSPFLQIVYDQRPPSQY